MKDSDNDSKRREAQADLRRLTSIILDHLQEDSRNRLMEPREIRLLGGTAIPCIRLYLKTLEEDRAQSLGTVDDSAGSNQIDSKEDKIVAGKDSGD